MNLDYWLTRSNMFSKNNTTTVKLVSKHSEQFKTNFSLQPDSASRISEVSNVKHRIIK